MGGEGTPGMGPAPTESPSHASRIFGLPKTLSSGEGHRACDLGERPASPGAARAAGGLRIQPGHAGAVPPSCFAGRFTMPGSACVGDLRSRRPDPGHDSDPEFFTKARQGWSERARANGYFRGTRRSARTMTAQRAPLMGPDSP